MENENNNLCITLRKKSLEFDEKKKENLLLKEENESFKQYINNIENKYGFDFMTQDKKLAIISQNSQKLNEELTKISLERNIALNELSFLKTKVRGKEDELETSRFQNLKQELEKTIKNKMEIEYNSKDRKNEFEKNQLLQELSILKSEAAKKNEAIYNLNKSLQNLSALKNDNNNSSLDPFEIQLKVIFLKIFIKFINL